MESGRVMSTLACTPPACQAPSLRARAYVAVTPDVVALTALAALFALLAALTWGTWGNLGMDTGYDLAAAARVAHGDVPYADFTYYYGPLAPGLLGLAALVGGTGTTPAIVVGLVLSAAIVATTYALARTFVAALGAFLAAAIVASIAFSPTNVSYILPHATSAPLAVLATLLFLLGVIRWEKANRTRWLVVAGVSAGLVALTRPEFALAVIVAASLWLALRARATPTRVARDVVALIAPAVLIPVAVYGTLFTVVSPARLLENLYPRDQLSVAGNAVLRVHAPLTPASFAELGARFALYAAGVTLLVGLGLLLARRGRATQMIAVGALGVLLLGTAAANPEAIRSGLQNVYGWIPVGAALALGVSAVRAARRGWRFDSLARAELLVAAVLLVLAAKDYASFFLWADKAQPAVYAAPFAVLLLLRLHVVELARFPLAAALGAAWLAFLAIVGVGLTLKDARAESVAVRGPGGAISATPDQARLYQAALGWIASETRPGDSILVAPQGTALYALAGRRDPLRQLSLLPGALPTVADERNVIDRLRERHVRLVITDRHAFTEYGHTSFGGSFDRVLAGWIGVNFIRVATLRGGPGVGDHVFDVWLGRRGS